IGLESWQSDVRQLLASGDLAFLDDAAAKEDECRALLAALSAQLSDASTDIRMIERDDAITDADGDGVLAALIGNLRGHSDAAQRIGARCAALHAAIRPRQLERDERSRLEAIARIGNGRDAPLDIGAILDDPASGCPSLADIWPLIDGLYRKRRVRVQVKAIGPTGA